MILLQNVSKKFGPIKAVNDVSFEIKTGEVVGFLGPNGAGKTTTMRMIVGFLPPNSGTIKIANQNILLDPVSTKRKIGYMPESAALYFEMVVTDFLLFMGHMRGLTGNVLKNRLKIVVNQCQIEGVLRRKIGDLSKGYKQRVGLAQALLHDPDILILDEPTVGLDPNQIVEIRQLIKEIGKTKTILLSTHILSEVTATCQQVIIINNGKIVAKGTPHSLIDGSNQKMTYRVSLRGDLDVVKNRFEQFPHFLELEVLQSDNGVHHVLVHCNGGEDLSEDIFDLAVENRWRLSQLVKEQVTLEDVFKHLTK